MYCSSFTSSTLSQAPGCGMWLTFSGRTDRMLGLPAGISPAWRARNVAPQALRCAERPAAASSTVPSIRLFSPMKLATKALAGRS
ncbi:hypothetical protein D3C77_770820 [compost metagenome]